ncbi:hypothetical protein FRC12_022660 [Ceratobasidium sp. 428]|nr:hypothetical protein FRC12_022660 [Ceratobasidium sp. 428]
MLHPKQHSYIEKFVGGTAFQAFLSPQDYHRWHSPITGEVISAEIVEGTYYAVLPDKGVYDDEEEIDPRGALIRSQPWLTANATRAVFVIKPKNPWMDYVCFIGVGMAEVSSCDITVHAGDNVDAGQELGMFHFGGSSYVVICGPYSRVRWMTEEGVVQKGKHIHLNKAIGVSVAQG